MPAFYNPHEPVAKPGEAVRLEPSNRVFEVLEVEQMARVGPVDFGAATSGNSATESGSSIIDLEDELDMNDNQLGQFLLNPISLVDVEVRQTGDQDQRFVNKNQVGVITPYEQPNQRLVWVYEANAPRVIITNNQTWDMAKTLIYFTGFKYDLASDPMDDRAANKLPGSPASVPVDSLKKQPSEATG